MRIVLIVEDEKMIRQGIRAMIQRSGVPVETIMECNNGQMAFEILKNQRVDVMFTDIRMPKMSGIELVQKMQELPHKPLTVAISGYDDFSYAVEMLRNGVKEYMLKPVDRDKMKEVLLMLEKELENQQEKERNTKIIGCQQLRQIMLADEIPQKELYAAGQRLEEELLYPAYHVCCLEKSGEDVEERDAYLYLEEVGDNSIYIVSQENCTFLLKNELRDSHVGVSRVHSGIEELHAAYLEAREARKTAFCQGLHIVMARDIAAKEKAGEEEAAGRENGVDLPQDEPIHKIVQMIGTDKIKEALRLTEQFMGKVKKNACSPAGMEHFLQVLVQDIMRTYQNALEEKKESLKQFLTPYVFSDIDELLAELTGWMIMFHEKIDTRFEDYRNKQKMQQAVRYIHENYSSDLNMAVVSNYVSMNYSLFSFAFKQYTGTNFVNYLKELRMEEAKRLLTQTQLRVVEVSQKVGYENEKHFMKIFKSVCGVSPTEYRKNMELRTIAEQLSDTL